MVYPIVLLDWLSSFWCKLYKAKLTHVTFPICFRYLDTMCLMHHFDLMRKRTLHISEFFHMLLKSTCWFMMRAFIATKVSTLICSLWTYLTAHVGQTCHAEQVCILLIIYCCLLCYAFSIRYLHHCNWTLLCKF